MANLFLNEPLLLMRWPICRILKWTWIVFTWWCSYICILCPGPHIHWVVYLLTSSEYSAVVRFIRERRYYISSCVVFAYPLMLLAMTDSPIFEVEFCWEANVWSKFFIAIVQPNQYMNEVQSTTTHFLVQKQVTYSQ